MIQRDVVTEIRALVQRRGENHVAIALLEKGVAITTANLLVTGRYKSQPGGLLQKAIADVLDAESEKAS